MKFKFIKVPFILTLLCAVALTGCLKDGYFDNGTTQAYNGGTIQTISLDINALSAQNYSALPIPNIFTDTTVQFVQVELGGPNAAAQDITVTLDTSSAILDSFNNVGIGPGDLYDPGTIQIVNPVVVIPKGQRVAWLQIKFLPHDYIGQDVALGFFIKSVSPSGYTIGANQSAGAVGLVIENYLDGKYNLTIKSIGGTPWSGAADGQTYNWPAQVIYGTVGSNTNTINSSYGGNLLLAFTASGGQLAFGSLIPGITVDPNTFAITSIDNLYGPNSRGRDIVPNPAVTDNRYDPTTRTIYASYGVIQTNPPRTTMYIYDTLVYQGPR